MNQLPNNYRLQNFAQADWPEIDRDCAGLVCMRGDGIICPDDSCDIDDGVCPAPHWLLSIDSVEQTIAGWPRLSVFGEEPGELCQSKPNVSLLSPPIHYQRDLTPEFVWGFLKLRGLCHDIGLDLQPRESFDKVIAELLDLVPIDNLSANALLTRERPKGIGFVLLRADEWGECRACCGPLSKATGENLSLYNWGCERCKIGLNGYEPNRSDPAWLNSIAEQAEAAGVVCYRERS